MRPMMEVLTQKDGQVDDLFSPDVVWTDPKKRQIAQDLARSLSSPGKRSEKDIKSDIIRLAIEDHLGSFGYELGSASVTEPGAWTTGGITFYKKDFQLSEPVLREEKDLYSVAKRYFHDEMGFAKDISGYAHLVVKIGERYWILRKKPKKKEFSGPTIKGGDIVEVDGQKQIVPPKKKKPIG